MMNKTKRYSIQIILLLFTIYTAAQAPATILKGGANGAYTVTGTETLVATQSITLSPNTHIKAGSTFIARISPDDYIPIFALSNENFILTRKYAAPLKSSQEIANNSDVIESISYHDGLGRPLQNIAIKGAPNKNDIVIHIKYDNVGRQEKEYLPYMDDLGAVASYRNSIDAETRTNNYYKLNYPQDIDNTLPNPFSQKKFEDSPLNRVLMQAAPGKDWALNAGHEIKSDYQTNNTTTDAVKLFTFTTSLNSDNVYVPSVPTSTSYADNQLYKTVIKDENWLSGKNNTTEEFKNKEGQVILKRTYSDYGSQTEVAHDTYYLYDTYGNLTYVLPPKAEGIANTSTLADLCYQYKYDKQNRLIEKKLPGKEWEYIIYDKLDRPILTQDANLRAANKWLFTKYDAFNRPIYTGEYINTLQTTRAAVQTEANKTTVLFENKQVTSLNINGTSVNYTNTAFPTANIDLFTINYYDDYANIDLDGGTSVASYGITPITNVKGLGTCLKVRILDTASWITTVNYYDTKGRIIYTYSKNNYLTATSTVKTKLDFAGKVLETTSTHKKGTDPVITIVDVYSYDHTGRLLIEKQTINNQAQETIVSNTYDNLGQLTTKGVGGKTTQTRLQNVDYSYNIRGWLKNINNINSMGNDLFAFQINYNTTTANPDNKVFNGNISQTFWKTANLDNSMKNYTYTYDKLNRLTQATDNSTLNAGRYNESLSYDKNGNIMSILRLGNTNATATTFGTMDNLTYTYDTGNKLTKVEDTSGSTEGFNNGSSATIEYTYDSNGNMKTDANKKITAVSYNHLNLPTSVTINGGTINYVYDASGIKQRKTVSTGSSNDYAGSFVYENNILKQFSQPEGYIVYNAGIYSYIYQYKDHLGNIRLSYQDKDNNGYVNSSEIVQENNYYAFGLTQKGYNGAINGTDNKYKFSGKDLQDELGLNMYDYGMRNYDPALGRWMNIDPLAELSRRWSPYNYAYNNPNYFIDPDGMLVDTSKIKEEGKDDGSSMGKYLEEQAEITNEINKSFKAYLESLSNGSEEDESEEEEPVSLFSSGNNRFDGVVKSRKYKKGDRSFTVFGHGAIHFMFDELGRFTVRNAEDFDKMMSALNDQWDDAKGKKGTTLSLWTCESARIGKNGLSLAQMISEAYPNITVIGADGYVNYREIDKNTGPCEYKISGVSKVMYSGKNDGDLVAYKNGVEVSRKKF
ncbi:DUF6443 domain-containing protein [Flavobacterium sp. H4147]|uniref:DUF6443 domain-containing protein n=1 Tax=Flavobacterium sp. H4147 TaxID=3034149 RepID=UPI0023EA9361|nr:DUF6443 domain-containing protein [Flavobacterium sp. H4147]